LYKILIHFFWLARKGPVPGQSRAARSEGGGNSLVALVGVEQIMK